MCDLNIEAGRLASASVCPSSGLGETCGDVVAKRGDVDIGISLSLLMPFVRSIVTEHTTYRLRNIPCWRCSGEWLHDLDVLNNDVN